MIIMFVPAFPAPILFGMAIDSACVVLQGACTKSRSGACLLYDNGAFRLRLHGFLIMLKFCALVMYTVALLVSRTSSYKDGSAEKRKSIGHVEEEGDDDDEELVVFRRDGGGDSVPSTEL